MRGRRDMMGGLVIERGRRCNGDGGHMPILTMI